MTKDYKTFALSAQNQRQGEDPLLVFLTSHMNAPVRLDLSAVPDVTAMRLQLLVSAHKQWKADGVPMILSGMTETFRDGLGRLGVPADFFAEECL